MTDHPRSRTGQPPLPTGTGRPAPAGAAPRRMAMRDLAGTASEVEIEHQGQVYRLRITRQDKLILTK